LSIALPKEFSNNKKDGYHGLVDSKNLLLIFTRNPELGKCKTRLAATVGDETALDIYKFLLQRTASITKDLRVVKEVYYSMAIWKNDVWDNQAYTKKLQQGEDLGERMGNAFRSGFESGFEKIIIIGSDMYDLNTADLKNAFKILNDSDYVVGPAQDGGYYLLGMKVFDENLFKAKLWGTETVLQHTLNDLKNKKVELLETKNDIDVYEDIENMKVFQPYIKHIK